MEEFLGRPSGEWGWVEPLLCREVGGGSGNGDGGLVRDRRRRCGRYLGRWIDRQVTSGSRCDDDIRVNKATR